MKIENELFEKSNIPIIPQKFKEHEHKVFIKYTKSDNYKYAYEILTILTSNSKSKNKISLFYKSLKCLLKVLYNLYNNEILLNYDLLILSCFYLGLKINEIITKVPKIKKIKELFPEKYHGYEQNSIREAEVICIKLLDYNIDILTSYDCLVYLLNENNNNNLLDLAQKELENIIKNNLYDFIIMPPFEVAKLCINKVKKLKHYYIQPSLLIKEYNKNKFETKKSSNLDNNYPSQANFPFKKIKHSTVFSPENILSPSKKDNYDNKRYYLRKRTSIYNCSFKILKKLSKDTKPSYSNMTAFTNFKNNINFNINESLIGKKLYEKSINTTSKKSSVLFKNTIFPTYKKDKEEKENYSNSNLLLYKNKDINCNRNYNRVIMIGQKKLFQV